MLQARIGLRTHEGVITGLTTSGAFVTQDPEPRELALARRGVLPLRREHFGYSHLGALPPARETPNRKKTT